MLVSWLMKHRLQCLVNAGSINSLTHGSDSCRPVRRLYKCSLLCQILNCYQHLCLTLPHSLYESMVTSSISGLRYTGNTFVQSTPIKLTAPAPPAYFVRSPSDMSASALQLALSAAITLSAGLQNKRQVCRSTALMKLANLPGKSASVPAIAAAKGCKGLLQVVMAL